MTTTNLVAICIGGLVALAVLAVATYAVGKLSKKSSVVLVSVLLALAALVGSLPAVIRAFQPEPSPVDPPAITHPAGTPAPSGSAPPVAATTAKPGR